MIDLDNLSDEELAALEKEAMAEEAVNLDQYSDEELKSMEAEALKESQKNTPEARLGMPEGADVDKFLKGQGFNIQPKLAHSSKALGPENLLGFSNDVLQTDTQVSPLEILDTLEIEAAGALQGATLGTASTIYGAARAAADIIGDQSFMNFNNNRRAYTDQARAKFDEIRDSNPAAFGIGEALGGAVPGFLTGGLTQSVRGAAAIGGTIAGTQAYFTSSNPDAREVMTSALFGGTVGGAFTAIPKAGPKLAEWGERMGISQAFGGLTKPLQKAMTKWRLRNKVTKDEVADLLLDKELQDGTKLITPGQLAEETYEKLGQARVETWDMMKESLLDLESSMLLNVPIEGRRFMADIDAKILYAESKVGTRALAQSWKDAKRWAKAELDQRIFTPSEMHEKIANLNKGVNWRDDLADVEKKEIIGNVRRYFDDYLDKFAPSKNYPALKELRKEYGLYKELSDQVAKNMDRNSAVFSPVKDGLLGYAALAATEEPMAAVASIGARMIATSNAFKGSMGKTLRTVGDAIQRNPEKWGKYAQSLAIAANGTYRDFDNEMAYVEAQMTLQGAPVARNTSALLDKKDKLLSILYKHDSNLANTLTEALDAYDYGAAGIVMDNLGKDPRFTYLIEPGIGWDGKVLNDADKQQLQADVISGQTSRQISTAQKLEAINALKQGNIPQLNQSPAAQIPRALRDIIPRDESGRKINPY